MGPRGLFHARLGWVLLQQAVTGISAKFRFALRKGWLSEQKPGGEARPFNVSVQVPSEFHFAPFDSWISVPEHRFGKTELARKRFVASRPVSLILTHTKI